MIVGATKRKSCGQWLFAATPTLLAAQWVLESFPIVGRSSMPGMHADSPDETGFMEQDRKSPLVEHVVKDSLAKYILAKQSGALRILVRRHLPCLPAPEPQQ